MKAMSYVKLMLIVAVFAAVVSADPYMGQYKGTFYPDSVVTMKATAKVVAEGDDVYYRMVVVGVPNEDNQEGANIEVYGHRNGDTIMVSDRSGGYHWTGEIRKGHLSLRSEYGQHFELDKFVARNPALGAKAPNGAIVLLAQTKDKPDTSAWTNQQWKKLDGGVMQVEKGSSRTKQSFGDIEHLHIEFKLPLEPNNRGQGRSNSGMFLSGLFEVQILDSFGLTYTSGDCGSLYSIARPLVNACLPPEQWECYDVKFRAARLNADGSVKENARVTVRLNGVLIQDNVEIPHPTANPKADIKANGPIELQDHGHPLQFRNIWLVKG